MSGSQDTQVTQYKETKQAVQKARAVREFLLHLAGYVVSNIFFGVWNGLTYYVKDEPTLWFYIPLIFWGVGVIIHYVQGVVLFDDWWRRDESVVDANLRELPQ